MADIFERVDTDLQKPQIKFNEASLQDTMKKLDMNAGLRPSLDTMLRNLNEQINSSQDKFGKRSEILKKFGRFDVENEVGKRQLVEALLPGDLWRKISDNMAKNEAQKIADNRELPKIPTNTPEAATSPMQAQKSQPTQTAKADGGIRINSSVIDARNAALRDAGAR